MHRKNKNIFVEGIIAICKKLIYGIVIYDLYELLIMFWCICLYVNIQIYVIILSYIFFILCILRIFLIIFFCNSIYIYVENIDILNYHYDTTMIKWKKDNNIYISFFKNHINMNNMKYVYVLIYIDETNQNYFEVLLIPKWEK